MDVNSIMACLFSITDDEAEFSDIDGDSEYE